MLWNPEELWPLIFQKSKQGASMIEQLILLYMINIIYMINMLHIWTLSTFYRFSNTDSTLFILDLSGLATSLPTSPIIPVLSFTLKLSLSLAGNQGRCCCTRAPQAWASTSSVARMEKASSSPSSWQVGQPTWAASWGGATGYCRSVS